MTNKEIASAIVKTERLNKSNDELSLGRIFKIKEVYKHPLTVVRVEKDSIQAESNHDKVKYWLDNDSIEYYKSIGKFQLVK